MKLRMKITLCTLALTAGHSGVMAEGSSECCFIVATTNSCTVCTFLPSSSAVSTSLGGRGRTSSSGKSCSSSAGGSSACLAWESAWRKSS